MKTLVYGLGESGVAATHVLVDRGEDVVVADGNDTPRLRETLDGLGAGGVLGAGPGVLDGVDRVVVSPGVRPADPVLLAAEERGLEILPEVGLGLELVGAGVRVAAVTGTNGKTTVVDMLRRILEAAAVPHAVAGNSWRALSGCFEEARSTGILVLELSSFQLHYLRVAGFDVAALLNARPDHLNWHDSFEEYTRDKLRVFAGQGPEDLALVSAADPVGHRAAGSLPAETLVVGEGSTLVRDGALFVQERRLAGVEELRFVGAHNHENAIFAAAAAMRLGAAPEAAREALLDYRPKPHRMQVVAEWDGVLYVDDSKATNPAAVAAALSGAGRPVVLILGGSEKDTDFSEVVPYLSRCRAVVCQGEAGPRLFAYLRGQAPGVTVRLAKTLDAAVCEAEALARPGDVILLSPGCASFDQHGGYAERGDAFAGLVGRAAAQAGALRR